MPMPTLATKTIRKLLARRRQRRQQTPAGEGRGVESARSALRRQADVLGYALRNNLQEAHLELRREQRCTTFFQLFVPRTRFPLFVGDTPRLLQVSIEGFRLPARELRVVDVQIGFVV